MSIHRVHGTDFYNYRIRDAKIVDIQHQAEKENEGNSGKQIKDYQAHLRDHQKYGKCKKFRRFLYNSETRKSCNRTGNHWGSMIFYYAFFLGMLLVLFMCYFYGIHRTMMPTNQMLPPIPKFYSSEVPTFTFVPISVNPYPIPFLWYRFRGVESTRNRKFGIYVEAIRDYYKAQATICAKLKNSEVCKVHPSFYGPCGESLFGYNEQKPCLFLKLNVKRGFLPDAFHSQHKLPKTMPKKLEKIIDLNRETLCVYCNGESNHDRRHIEDIKYYPEPCYNDSFFPNSETHLDNNPTIAIQVHPDPGYILELTCRLYGVHADGTGEHKQSVYIYIGNK